MKSNNIMDDKSRLNLKKLVSEYNPDVGDTFGYFHFRFIILKVARARVTLLFFII